MPRIKLTAKGIETLTTDRAQDDFWDLLTPGLCLRVSGATGGRRTWFVRYRVGSKHRRQKLGTYPRLGLADARDKAKGILQRADAGEDPAQEREDRRSQDGTFGAMAWEVLGAKADTTRERTRKERERILRAELLPAWGPLPAGAVTRRDVSLLVEAIARRGAPVGANRTLALVKALYNEALRRGFPGVEANPAHMARPPRPEPGRGRYLEREEIRAVWGALEPERLIPGAIFRLALLTTARIGSVCAMRWADLDGADVWAIPAEVFKGRRPHLVPLSGPALAEIESLRPLSGEEEYVFPSRAGTRRGHVTNTAGSLARIRKRSGLPEWTAHDFRRTFRTHATRATNPPDKRDPAGLGIAPHVADAVLGHKEASLGFDRYTGEPERYLLSEKREALERWGAFVMGAVEAEDES